MPADIVFQLRAILRGFMPSLLFETAILVAWRPTLAAT